MSFGLQLLFVAPDNIAAMSNMWKPKDKIVESKKGTTYELALPVAAKGSKISCSSGEVFSAAGSEGLDAPESFLSGFLYLLRLSEEVAGGGEIE
jgi:hypothetical protein